MQKYTKLDVAGKPLPEDAQTWAAVLDTSTNLVWQREESKRMTHAAAEKAVAKLAKDGLAGANDWRLPTIQELLTLVDYGKYRPAIDTAFFPDCNSDWYWTGSPAAYSPADCAWVVAFLSGCSGWAHRDGGYFVRAVRSASPAAASQ